MNKQEKQIIVNNYANFYGIPEQSLEQLEDQIVKSNYLVYKKICQLIESSFVVCHNKYFLVEINVEQNHKLVNDLFNFLLKILVVEE